MLCSLLDEILVKILQTLDVKDRNLQCKLVNRRLKSVIDNSVILQVSTECELANLTLGESRHATLPDVLALLAERQNVWRTLKGMQELVIPLTAEEEGSLPVFGSECRMLCRSLLESKKLICTRIPSRTRNVPVKTWTLNVDMRAWPKIVVDDRQDLLALVYARRDDLDRRIIIGAEIRLLSLTTGDVHSAAQGTINLTLPPSYIRDQHHSPSIKVALAGDSIGIMLHWARGWDPHNYNQCHLWVCNWKAGDVKLEAWCGNKESELSNADSFAFLSPDNVLIALYDCPTISRIDLLVVNIRGPAQRGTYGDIKGAVFSFPEPEYPAHFGRIDIIEGSAPSYCSSDVHSMLSHKPDTQMLWIDLLLLADRTTSTIPIPAHRYRLAIPAAHLLRCLSKTLSSSPFVPELKGVEFWRQDNLRLSWPDWGGEVRWVPKDPSLMMPEVGYARFCSTSWAVKEMRTPAQLKTQPSPVPGHTGILDVIALYDFPHPVQMQRESRLPRPPFDSSGPLTLIEVNYYNREAVSPKGITWNFPVVSAPYRQTIFMTEIVRPFCMISPDGLVLRDVRKPNSPWRVFSI